LSFHHRFEEKIQQQHEDRAILPVIDVHVHFVDFLQRSDGFGPLLSSMEQGNIDKVLVFGLPVKKKWEYFEPREPTYYLGDNAPCYYFTASDHILAQHYERLSAEQQQKIAPTICAFNPTDLSAIRHVEHMLDQFPFWRGVGEVMLRHDDLTNLTRSETARANHPAMDPIYALCAREGLPLCLHQNSTSVGIHDEYVYLHELCEPLERHPDLALVWAHCGISRRVTHRHYHRMVSDMLTRYPNLYVDLSWVTYEDAICEPRRSGERLVPKQSWIDLIQRYPDRVMLGSDVCGHFDVHARLMARYNGLLAKLPEDIREKVAWRNAETLYFCEE
jgi:hypothetical protein